MRRGSFWLSPIGFLGHFGRKSSETLGFPGKRRKRHAETTEPSGKSGLIVASHAAGLLHDLGKFRADFQQYIRDLPVSKEKTYHKQAGAARAADAGHFPLAFAIAGHHGGMPDREDLKTSIKHDDSARPVAQAVWPDAVALCPELDRLVLAA